MPPTTLLPRPRIGISLRVFAPSLPWQPQQRRTFLSSLLSSSPLPPQTLTASRRLPYNHAALYALIADIDSYSAFLPYCSVSRVTAWSHPDPQNDTDPLLAHRRWPTRADLTAGWGGLEQTYTSRVLCVPGSIVEALSGDGARSGIAPDVLARYGLRDEPPTSAPGETGSSHRSGSVEEEGVFKTLVTRWTVTPVSRLAAAADGRRTTGVSQQTEWSDIDLNIRFQFANPLYGAVSSAVADKVAPVMIEAFVKRADKLLGGTAR
ncbi:hypothetical protein F4808DRAFT_133676 [Astrocystis sublimbata]|nr:hypothetical protein F4808DRAFT_133676 [Astrocystis sublimbata]